MARDRRRWRVWQRYMDPASFVFLDETGAATNMIRRYGWGPRGKRLVDAAPHGHWRTTTFVAGLRSTGLIAPLVLDGPMTGQAFRAYVEQALVPALSPGDVVVLDNLTAHKVAGVREAITAVGASMLHLPLPAFAGAGLYGVGSVKCVFRSEGNSPWCAGAALHTCIRQVRQDLDHDAVMRIGGAVPGRQAHSLGRRRSHACLGSPPPRII